MEREIAFGVEGREREGPKRTPGIQGGLEDSEHCQDGDSGRVLRRGWVGRGKEGEQGGEG